MTIGLDDLKAHINVTFGGDDSLLTRLLAAASAATERQLGFALNDTAEFPDGAPADVEHAVLMLAAHWYSNREASIVGVTAQAVPLGYDAVIAEHRRYTFGLTDEAA